MKKKSTCIFLIAMLTFTFVMAGATYAATESDNLKDQLSGVQAEKNEVSSRLADVKKQIDEMQPKVDSLNAEVAAANKQIAQTEKEIADKQEEMKNREDGLNERLRVMYKNGSVGFIDVLLGSNSISEFISNLEMIQKIYKNDMEVLETLKQEQKELEEIKERLKDEKAELDTKKAELDTNLKELNSLKSELEAQEDQLLEEAQALNDKIAALSKPDTSYEGGAFVWPAPASRYIISPFGWRMHPVYNVWKYHSGIDIAAGQGTNVLAAASGTVILSVNYGNASYGECIVIDHGGGISTLYGHMTRGSRRVSVGDKVSAGQVIGLVGSTGVSTGPHLHFEVRNNGQLVDPLGYVS